VLSATEDGRGGFDGLILRSGKREEKGEKTTASIGYSIHFVLARMGKRGSGSPRSL